MLALILTACLCAPPTTATVSRVIDGDTVQLSTGEKVRLVAIDAPESVDPRKPVEHFGKEASAYLRKLLDGEKVELTYDQNNAAKGHKDRYGRLLCYVRRARDGLEVNAEMVRSGHAHAYSKYPSERAEEMRKLEREAQEAKRGLWDQP